MGIIISVYFRYIALDFSKTSFTLWTVAHYINSKLKSPVILQKICRLHKYTNHDMIQYNIEWLNIKFRYSYDEIICRSHNMRQIFNYEKKSSKLMATYGGLWIDLYITIHELYLIIY